MASRKIVVEVLGDSKSLERMFARAGSSATVFSAKVTRSLSGIAKSFGLLAGGTGIVALAVSLKNATSAAADFQLTMQKLVGLSGIAQSKIAGLSQDVLKLAPAVGKGPQELAEGLQFITSSGIDAAHALGVLTASAKGSAAGLGDTKTVADAVTSVMNAYGPAVVNAGRATDVLVATVREGKGEATEFAGVIGNVVSIASQLGVSFEDVGAALAAMTRLGTDADTAATQLQQVFSNLVKVTPKQEAAFEAVGLSAAGLRKELASRGLLAVLKTIKTAFAGDLPGLANAFGDIRALRGVLALVGNQSEQVNGIFRRLDNSAGSLDKSFNAISETAAQKFARFNAAVDVTRITIGAAFAPAAEKAATAVADWLAKTENQEKIQRAAESAIKSATGALKTMKSVFDGLLAVLKPTVDALGGLQNAAKLLLGVLVASKIVAYTTAITGIGNAALTSKAKVALLRASLARLGAIGIITIGIEVIINHDEITRKFNEETKRLPKRLQGPTIDFSKLDVKGLLKYRKQIQGLDGDSDQMVAGIDKALQKLLKLDSAIDKVESGRGKTQKKTTSTAGARGIGSAIQDALDLAKQQTNKALAKARGNAADSAKQFKEVFKTLNAAVTSAEATDGVGDDLAALRTLESAIQKQIETTGRTGDLVAKLAGVRKDIAAKIKEGAQDAKEKQQKAFSELADSLGLAVDRDLARHGFDQALKDNAALQAAIKKQIGVEGKTAALARQLFDAQQNRRDILSDKRQHAAAQKAKSLAKRTAEQFKSLGLTGTGEERAPSVGNLQKQLDAITNRLGDGAFTKIRSKLKLIGKVLADPIRKATPEIRKAIAEMFDAMRGEIGKQSGPLTKTTSLDTKKVLAGLDLSADLKNQLRGRLSGFNSAGIALADKKAPTGAFSAGPVVVESHTTVNLDGKKVASSVTRNQQKRARRNPAQRRGPNRNI